MGSNAPLEAWSESLQKITGSRRPIAKDTKQYKDVRTLYKKMMALWQEAIQEVTGSDSFDKSDKEYAKKHARAVSIYKKKKAEME